MTHATLDESDQYRAIAAQALAKCAAYDPWFPQPNRLTVEAWAEQLAHWKIQLPDALAGVSKMYEDNGSGFRPLPKDLIDAARTVRRIRTESESPAEREAREDARDAALEAHNQQRLGQLISATRFGKSIDAADTPAEHHPRP